jgi:ankyrin repeat protein
MTTLSPKYLIDAIRSMNQTEIDRLLPKTNLNLVIDDHSAIKECVIKEDYTTLKKLLSHHANINLIHQQNSTVLMDAESLNMVKFLVENGADIQLNNGTNILHLVIQRMKYFQHKEYANEDMKILQYLLDKGIDYKSINLDAPIYKKLNDEFKHEINLCFSQMDEKKQLENSIQEPMNKNGIVFNKKIKV